MAAALGRILSERAFASHVPIGERRFRERAGLDFEEFEAGQLFESEILGTRESKSRPTQGLVHVRTRALDQRGEEVCVFERNFLVYKRGQGPYLDTGY